MWEALSTLNTAKTPGGLPTLSQCRTRACSTTLVRGERSGCSLSVTRRQKLVKSDYPALDGSNDLLRGGNTMTTGINPASLGVVCSGQRP